MKEYTKFLRHLGIKVPPASQPTSKLFQKILKSVDGKPEKAMVEEMTLRTMQKAIYDTVNVGHFGLAFKEYTHFTSPIRRYSDLLVHRLLKSYRGTVAAEQADLLRENLPVWCTHMSHRERRAMEIERESVKMKQIEFLKNQVGDEFNGVISGVVPFGLFIQLEGILAEGLIHIRDLKDDYYRHDEARYALIGEKNGKEYRLAGPVRVRLIRVDQEDRKLDMVLIPDEADEAEESKKASEAPPTRKPRKKRNRKRR